MDVGDTVYMYVSAPYSCILYKCEVESVNIPLDQLLDNDKDFYSESAEYASYPRHMRLKKLGKYSQDSLGINDLKAHGLKAIQGPGRIQNQNLADFIHSAPYENQKVHETEVSMASINCLGLIKFLDQYAGQPYQSIEKVTDPDEKTRLETIKAAGQETMTTLKQMAKICADKFGLTTFNSGSWTDGSHTKIRDYLWCQMKKPEHEKSPISISIFVEKSATTGN